MTSVTSADAKGPPSASILSNPAAEGPGSGGGTTCAGVRSSSNNSNSPPGWVSPNYLKWSENLQHLLNDGTGVELLLKYLEQEDQDCFYMLRFWLAVRGSHQQPDQDHLNKCILAIYKGLFNKIKGGVSDDLRRAVTQRIRHAQAENKLLDAKVFAEACKVVENVMTDRMYPNFLSSDYYLSYVRDMQRNASHELPKNFSQQTLPVVNEDEELSLDAYRDRPGPGSVTYSTASTRLMHDLPYLKVHHLSYNPVSRQDSEVQSLSSGARTDSMPDLALEDASGVLGCSTGSTYAQKRRQMRINRNTDLVHIHEPRSSQPGIQERACAPEPKLFMSTLLPKLEKLKQEKENLEYVGLKLDSIDEDLATGSECGAGASAAQKATEDDDDQDILDRHVSRVWNEQTPKRSPCTGTPLSTRSKSPDARKMRLLQGGAGGCLKDVLTSSSSTWAPSTTWSCYSGMLRKRDKDAASLFSTDSGNGTDREHHQRNKQKSASESGAPAAPNYDPCYDPSYSGHYPPSVRPWTGSHKTMTDSGVSVAGSTGMAHSHRSRDRSGVWQVDRRLSSSKSRSLFGSGSQIFEQASSRNTKNKSHHKYQHSRSGVPAQPFVADTSMPPYPYYSIDPQTTVEEATRRLEEWKGTRDASEFHSSIGPHSSSHRLTMCENVGPHHGSQRLTMCESVVGGSHSGSQRSVLSDAAEYTSVVYNFSDENVPYLLRVQARPITLRMFKDHAPKKGNFRYFFQTECEELGGDTPIFEEITDNDTVLPLWKNKVISKITLA